MIEFELIVEDAAWSAVPDLEQVAAAAFEAANRVLSSDGQVAVLLTDDSALQALNRQFRNKDRPTDVLSFPAGENAGPMLGDIAIASGVASHDAAIQGKNLKHHLSHLLIHAYLHLLGHNHESEQEAAVMEALEIKALASLGIDNPYSERNTTS